MIAAVRRNSWVDYLIVTGATLAQAIPAFWLGLMLIIIFAVHFRTWGMPALPSGGTQTLPGGGGVSIGSPIYCCRSDAQRRAGCSWMRFIRSQMLEVIRQDYVRTARAKGASERVVILPACVSQRGAAADHPGRFDDFCIFWGVRLSLS